MKRRNFISKSALVVSVGTLSQSSPKKSFIHHVYFWLANPDSAEDKAQLIEALKKLAKTPVIKKAHIGLPADTHRDVVERSYQVSWCLFFNSPADQEVYQTHPIHLKFVEENKHLWTKVVVYDSIDQWVK